MEAFLWCVLGQACRQDARLRYWMALSSPMTCTRMDPACSPGCTSSSLSVLFVAWHGSTDGRGVGWMLAGRLTPRPPQLYTPSLLRTESKSNSGDEWTVRTVAEEAFPVQHRHAVRDEEARLEEVVKGEAHRLLASLLCVRVLGGSRKSTGALAPVRTRGSCFNILKCG